jgi:hypothetical protein
MMTSQTATDCPVPLAGGMLTLASGERTYVEPWRAWWLEKLWRGHVLPGDRGWREHVEMRTLEADYRAWAAEHCDYALHRLSLRNAVLCCAGLEPADFYRAVLDLRDLDRARRVWDNVVGPVRWPSAAPAPATRSATPRRPLAPAFALPIAA